MKKRRFLIPALVFLLYAALAWVGAYFLAPPDVFALVVFVLIALGLTVLIVYFLMARLHAQSVPRASVEPARESERITAHPASSDHPEVAGLTALINEANNRLARSPKLANRQVKATVTRLPLFLLGGIEGSGKTSTFLKSGLEPELLAGQVFHDSNVLPTRLANFWFAEDCLFVELSGALFSGGIGLWSAILAKLQGRSAKGFLKRIFGGKTEAQLRGFVLFCNIAPFLGVPDPSQLGGLSRRIQERLRAVGESFGTNFPVYVVFTNSEGIPYFNEFFSRLLESEDQQILGCTLPALAPGARPAGEVYAESETARVSAALNNLYYSLAEKRLAVLPRETNLPARPFVYEFPREMKRIRDTLVQFLVDVFRPNPLQPGPILRGCYFTGTRQVTASALGPAGAENIARPSHGEATSLFNLAEYQQKMGLAPETPQGLAETTIQRWSFVAELFHRVILPDPIGRAVAFASSQQTMYKRIAFGAAAALGLIAGLFWIRSWWNNASLLGDIEAAAQTSDTFRPNVRAVPSHDTLKGLDGLRVQLQTLLDYDRHGAPWRMRSGLYAGEHVLPAAYGLYFQRFQQLFFEEILSSFSGTLKRLPLSPDSRNSYDDTYDRVKAYRMVTQGRCSPDPPFLVPVMASAWFAGRTLDEDSQSLVLKQLSFYANELKLQNPYPKAAEDRDAVGHGQLYLASFGGSSDRLYRSLIEEANKSPRSPARLADLAPNYKLALNSPGEVAAAYTKDGWVFGNSAIKDPSNLKLGDPCFLGNGDTAKQLLQIPELQSDLQNLYVRDYIRRWKDFTAATNVVSFGSVADASNKLDILADNRSPLLAAVFMIAENTNFPAQQKAPPIPASVINKFVPSGAKKALNIAKQTLGSSRTADMGDITRIFQPARAIVSVDNRDRWITDPNQAYMTALANLRLAMQRLKDDRSSSPDLSLNKEDENDVNFGPSQVTEVVQRFKI
jgi:type VI secretion system protein ImpL